MSTIYCTSCITVFNISRRPFSPPFCACYAGLMNYERLILPCRLTDCCENARAMVLLIVGTVDVDRCVTLCFSNFFGALLRSLQFLTIALFVLYSTVINWSNNVKIGSNKPDQRVWRRKHFWPNYSSNKFWSIVKYTTTRIDSTESKINKGNNNKKKNIRATFMHYF